MNNESYDLRTAVLVFWLMWAIWVVLIVMYHLMSDVTLSNSAGQCPEDLRCGVRREKRTRAGDVLQISASVGPSEHVMISSRRRGAMVKGKWAYKVARPRSTQNPKFSAQHVYITKRQCCSFEGVDLARWWLSAYARQWRDMRQVHAILEGSHIGNNTSHYNNTCGHTLLSFNIASHIQMWMTVRCAMSPRAMSFALIHQAFPASSDNLNIPATP
jgi:hypothetical protein